MPPETARRLAAALDRDVAGGRTAAGKDRVWPVDWDAFRDAMVAERRVLARFRPDRAYGMLRPAPPSEWPA